MRRILLIITGIMFITMLAGCTANEEAGDMSLFSKKMIVGTDIAFGDIIDFYYTEENINYDAYYQRYRFYVEDGKHLFFHETRERKNDYGPCTEEDTTLTGTIELSDDQWVQFCDLINGGTVRAREDSADSGDTGPWLFLYWKNDKSKYQQFAFESYGREAEFEEYCVSLVKGKYNLLFDRSGFQSEKTAYSEGETVTVIYDVIATDTDYSFYTDSDDVKLNQTYDNNRGYVFTFTMPAHDVKLFVNSRNTMEADPSAYVSDDPEDYITNENMVFDYYEATVATVGGDESTEYVLYEYDGSRLILACYRKSEDSEETMHYCFVSPSVLDDCMKLVKKYEMAEWENGRGLNGKRYVVRFQNDGEMIRVSSDDMPEDGREAFSAVRQVLATEWGNASRNVEAGTWFCPECGTRNEGQYCAECGFKKES